MNANQIRNRFVGLMLMTMPGLASAAEYRAVPTIPEATAGQTVNVAVEVETEPGDNLVGFGHFAFAIDLLVGGDTSAAAGSITNVLINETLFDDTLSNSIGHPDGMMFIDTGGATTDALAPNFGAVAGDVVDLFTFDLVVPLDAAIGQNIVLTPSEGFLQNVTVNDNFDLVAPQNFTPGLITVIPEPDALALLLIGAAILTRRARP